MSVKAIEAYNAQIISSEQEVNATRTHTKDDDSAN